MACIPFERQLHYFTKAPLLSAKYSGSAQVNIFCTDFGLIDLMVPSKLAKQPMSHT